MNRAKKILNMLVIFLLPFLFGNTTGGCGFLEAIFSLTFPPPLTEPVDFNDANDYHSGGYILVAGRGNIFYADNPYEPPDSLYTVPGEPRLSSVIWIGTEVEEINIVVGDNGTILRSTKNNPEWTLISSPVTYNLNKITNGCFRDDVDNLFIVGDNGTILNSTDLGLTWSIFPSPTTENLHDIFFPETKLNGVSYINTNIATVVGSYGLILRTTDGGQNWSTQLSGTTKFLYGVSFSDANTGTVVGVDGKILRTTNGGQSWVTQISGTDKGLTDVFFVDSNIGSVVGLDGTILRTTDGGNTWVSQNSGTMNDLHSIHFTDTNTGTAVGYDYPGGLILRTTNGGQNWFAQSSGLNNDYQGTTFLGVHFTDVKTGTVVGVRGHDQWSGYEIIRTVDGGQSWVDQASADGSQFKYLHNVYFNNANNGIAVGSWDFIMKTIDGGENWSPQSPTEMTVSLEDISFSDANNGIAVGSTIGGVGTIIKTTDGGNNWITSQPIDGCNQIILSGSNYALYRSVDGGQNWFPIGIGKKSVMSSGDGFIYKKIYFYDDLLGFTAGPNGLILKTTDGGWQWTYRSAPGIDQINDIYFISPDTGVAVGTNGQVRFTTDGGNNWFEETSVTDYLAGREVKRIFALSRNHGFVVGEGNLLTFAATDSTYLDSTFTVTSVDDKITIFKDFFLYQNYPNPFNPSTNIQYAVSNRQFISLKIYDVLGNEIETLVNEEKPAGTYEITWYAEQLPSGVYFYQLKAEEFISVKKMLLLK
jgi:photosystem II stability/assembly factor-like uncharacterized protein